MTFSVLTLYLNECFLTDPSVSIDSIVKIHNGLRVNPKVENFDRKEKVKISYEFAKGQVRKEKKRRILCCTCTRKYTPVADGETESFKRPFIPNPHDLEVKGVYDILNVEAADRWYKTLRYQHSLSTGR